MIKSCLWGSSIISSGPKKPIISKCLVISLYWLYRCSVHLKACGSTMVPKNKCFHITGTLADSHTDHEQRFSPVGTYLRVPDDGGSSWAGETQDPRRDQTQGTKTQRALRQRKRGPQTTKCPSSWNNGRRWWSGTTRSWTCSEEATLLSCSSPASWRRSPGHPNEGSLELAPTGQILSSKRSNVLPSLPSPMGRTLLDLGPGIVGGFLYLVHPTY